MFGFILATYLRISMGVTLRIVRVLAQTALVRLNHAKSFRIGSNNASSVIIYPNTSSRPDARRFFLLIKTQGALSDSPLGLFLPRIQSHKRITCATRSQDVTGNNTHGDISDHTSLLFGD